MLLSLFIHLFVFLFNKCNFIDKKIYFQLNNERRVVLNITNIYIDENIID